MFMTVMSLAIWLVSIPAFYAFTQQENSSNKTPASQRVQQENKDSKHKFVLNLPFTVSVTPIALPPGDNAWTVQIVSRGGFSGSGRGDVTITSEGTLAWSGADGSCTRRLSDEVMQGLTKSVLAAGIPDSGQKALQSGLCGDCYVTAMILQRRGTEGIVLTSALSWDDASQAKVPADILAVYEALMAQRGCKLQ